MKKRPTMLMILDGFGINDNSEANAVHQARTPVIDGLKDKYPYVKGFASGLYVGLPDGQMGNSEVGHLNLGAGRVVYQELTRITKEIEDGDFFKNKALISAIEHVKENDSAIHFMGLLSDGGVHSHNTHLYGLIELARREGLKKVYIHCFMDGRDTPPASGKDYIEELERVLKEKGTGRIASVSGRYYAMDRDNRWERVEKAYDCLVNGAPQSFSSAAKGVEVSYEAGCTDEFIVPFSVDGDESGVIKDNDAVVFFNFRPDRAREITRAFVDDDFRGFSRNKKNNLKYVCFTEYDATIQNVDIAFHKVPVRNTFGEYISSLGLKQIRIAETEKYAHVTFFFNGGIEEANSGEDRKLIPSPKVATYDLQPEMSAHEVCAAVIEAINLGKYDVIIMNFANPDMVGHTGVFDAAVKAIEAVDTCVGRIVEALKSAGGQCLLCADHGNAEQMIDYNTGEPHTAHTTNPVPFILINADPFYVLREDGALCDVAPTLLELMGIEKPAEMTGKSLLEIKPL